MKNFAHMCWVALLLCSHIPHALVACQDLQPKMIATGCDSDRYIVSQGSEVSGQSEKKWPEQSAQNEIKLDVVYLSQNDNVSCATTSIAMVISYYERPKDAPLDVEIVWKISGTNKAMVNRYGNDMEGVKRVAVHYGYKSKYLDHMKLSDVEHFLSKGIPVMLNVLKDKGGSATHAILITGYNKWKRIFYVNDPANEQNKILGYSDLESRWSAPLSSPRGMSYRSGFIVYPKACPDCDRHCSRIDVA